MDARPDPRGTTCARVVGLLGAACGATLGLSAPADAYPVDEEPGQRRTVLEGRATLDRAELADGGWSVVVDEPDHLVAVADPARVRVVVDAMAGPAAFARSDAATLVADLSRTPGLTPSISPSLPPGVAAVFDTHPAAGSVHDGVCAAPPLTASFPPGTTLTGEGGTKVVVGTPCVSERVYVVARGAGNLLVEVQAPKVYDNALVSLDSADDLVDSLVRTGTAVSDDGPFMVYSHP